MAASTVFVTGGSGFVGRNLIPFLISKGYSVKSLARSEKSSDLVKGLGAEPVFGDVTDESALQKGCTGADHVVHLAAKVDIVGELEEFREITVKGATKCLKAAQEAGCDSFTLISSEQAILGGPTLDNADETWPYPTTPDGPYALTKGEAERACFDAAKNGNTRVMVVRPRLIWGPGDTVVLPQFCKAIETGEWKWIAGGTHLTSTVHVSNCAAGILAAVKKGKSGEIYFVTDGEYVQFRDFMTKLTATQGVDASKAGAIPFWVAKVAGFFNFMPAPVVRLFGETCTVSDAKARRELDYENVISIEDGIKQLQEEFDQKQKEK